MIGNPRDRQCPKCFSFRGTLHDCDHCEQVCCSECSSPIDATRVLCAECAVELARRVVEESDDKLLELAAMAVAHEVEMALQPELAELHLLARAGCTPEETRGALARDRSVN